MKNIFTILLLTVCFGVNAQISNRILTGQNYLQDVDPDNVVFTLPPNDNRFFIARKTALRFNFNQVRGILDSVRVFGDVRYKSANWNPTWGSIEGKPSVFPTNRASVAGLNSVLDSIATVMNGKQPMGDYLTAINGQMVRDALGYDPGGAVPAYARSLTTFSVIKSSTDPLYRPITYTPSNSEIISALGFTPYNSTNPNNYISAAGAPVQSVNGQTGNVTITAPALTASAINTALGYTPYNGATNPNAYITTANAPVRSVNGKTGIVTVTAGDVGVTPITYYNASGTIPQPTKVWKARVPVTSSAMTIDLSSAGFTNVTNLIAHVDIERLGIAPANTITRKIRSLTATTLIVDLYQPLAIVLGGLGMTALSDFTNTWLHITVEGN